MFFHPAIACQTTDIIDEERVIINIGLVHLKQRIIVPKISFPYIEINFLKIIKKYFVYITELEKCSKNKLNEQLQLKVELI